jgi:hypothetical protein
MSRIEQLIATNKVEIISGEGLGPGTIETHTGARTMRAIKMRLTKERCDGDRWAKARVYSHTADGLSVFVNVETGEYC